MNSNLRKRLRYTARGLLALVAFVAFACFWVTWPKRTAEKFVVVYFRDLESNANPFREGTSEAAAFEANHEPRKRKLMLVSHKRTVADILLSRQTFDCDRHEFTICRGHLVSGPTQFWDSVARYYR